MTTVGTVLTSSDPEPPMGTIVAMENGQLWVNFGYYPCAWMRPGSSGGSYDDVETWTKVAGNYGPVTVKVWGWDDAYETWCPCGHATGGDYQCLNGSIYGPCGDNNCYGVCDDTAGTCKGDNCACGDD